MDYYRHCSVLWIAGWIPENLQWLLHELMTNGDCITVRWISQYLANWWKCHIWSMFPHTHPIQGLHPVFSRPLPFGDWLTSDGWLADGSRCTHGTSSAWFHNVSLPPSSLVNIEEEFLRWFECEQLLILIPEHLQCTGIYLWFLWWIWPCESLWVDEAAHRCCGCRALHTWTEWQAGPCKRQWQTLQGQKKIKSVLQY